MPYLDESCTLNYTNSSPWLFLSGTVIHTANLCTKLDTHSSTYIPIISGYIGVRVHGYVQLWEREGVCLHACGANHHFSCEGLFILYSSILWKKSITLSIQQHS